jgi:hypothetical protein
MFHDFPPKQRAPAHPSAETYSHKRLVLIDSRFHGQSLDASQTLASKGTETAGELVQIAGLMDFFVFFMGFIVSTRPCDWTWDLNGDWKRGFEWDLTICLLVDKPRYPPVNYHRGE